MSEAPRGGRSTRVTCPSKLNNAAALVIDRAVRTYIRYAPFSTGKTLLWDALIKRYLLWRPRTVTVRTVDGIRMTLHLPDLVQSFIYYFGLWEANLTSYLRQVLKPGDIVVDVGANVGYYSLLAASLVGKCGRVHAIEASPKIMGLLQENVAGNGFDNVVLHHKAASDTCRKIEIFSAERSANLGATTTRRVKAEQRGYQTEGLVEAMPLDRIVPRDDLVRARLIKIDVEGVEVPVLRGIAPMLGEFSDNTEFVIELTPEGIKESGETIEAILELFGEHCYRPYRLTNDYSPYPYLKAAPAESPKLLNGTDTEQVDVIFSKRPRL